MAKKVKDSAALNALFIAAGLLVLVTIPSDAPRGIRNNNPLNIRFSKSNNWVGQVGSDSAGFAVFSDAVYGLRAAVKLIANYGALYGANTIESIITRWAPPSENDTGAYIKHAVFELGIQSNQVVTREKIGELISVMVQHENGVNPYAAAQIERAIGMVYG